MGFSLQEADSIWQYPATEAKYFNLNYNSHSFHPLSKASSLLLHQKQ